MKIKSILILLFSLAFLFIGCENDVKPTESAMEGDETESLAKGFAYGNWEEGNDELEEKFSTAFTTHDPELFKTCFWNDPEFCFVTADGQVVRGYDNNSAGIDFLFSAFEKLEVEVIWIDRWRIGKIVYAVGEAHFKMYVNETDPEPFIEYDEVWTDGRMKIKGKWIVFLNHAHELTPWQ